MKQYKKMGEICTVISGTTPKSNKAEYWNGNCVWITPAEISEDSVYISDSERHITDIAVKESSLKSFPKGTVILSSRAPIGKVAIAGCEMYCNQGFKNLICSDAIYNGYLYFYLKAKKDYLNALGRGATFKEISKKIVENIEIPLPEIPEQKRVAAILFKIDTIIQRKNSQLQKLEELVKSRFIEMFGDPNSKLGKYSQQALESICSKINDGEHGSVPRIEKGIIFLNAKNIKKNGTIDWEQVTYIDEVIHNRIYKRCNPEPGDILLTTTGTIGNACIVPCVEQFSMDRGITLVKPNHKIVDSIFLITLLRSQYLQSCMNQNIHASAIGHLFLNKVKKLPVFVPPIDLQNEFADFVKSIDKSKLAIQKSLDDLETLKKSLMQKYFG